MHGGFTVGRLRRFALEAAGADHAFFSTCGSSLSVKAAMLSVAGPHEMDAGAGDVLAEAVREDVVVPGVGVAAALAGHVPVVEVVAATPSDHARNPNRRST